MTSSATLRSSVTPKHGSVLPVPEAFQPVLERFTSEARLHFGVDVVRLEPIGYQERPFSHVLHAAVLTPGGDRLTRIFVKVFKSAATPDDVERMSRRVARDFAATTRVHSALSQWNDVAVVRPLAGYPELLASITEEVSGKTLGEYLQMRAGWLASFAAVDALQATMERVGRWVRAFQTIDRSGGRLTVDALRSYVDLRLVRLTSLPAARFGLVDRERVLAYIDRLGSAVDSEDLLEVPIHADLTPGNIMVSEGRITVLDLAMSSVGSRLHDLARLYLQLELMGLKPQFRRSVLRHLKLSLLHGYDPGLDARRPMFRLLLMQHRINHLATHSTSREAFPASAYSWHIRRSHRGWIARELRSAEEGG